MRGARRILKGRFVGPMLMSRLDRELNECRSLTNGSIRVALAFRHLPFLRGGNIDFNIQNRVTSKESPNEGHTPIGRGIREGAMEALPVTDRHVSLLA